MDTYNKSLAMISASALILACGCPKNKVNKVYANLQAQTVPDNPEDIIDQIDEAISKVINRPSH